MLHTRFSNTGRAFCILTLSLYAAPAAMAQDAAPAEAPDDAAQSQAAEELWLPTLHTENPQEGFDLAISIARRAVKTTQPDVSVLKEQRPIYSSNADSLIAVSHAAAAWFATIAAANAYWED